MDALIRSLESKDLPNEGLQYLETVIGMDAVRKLLEACKGMSFYIPVKMPPGFYEDYIHTNYRQADNNVRDLARLLGITENHVYRLLRQKRKAASMAA